MEVSMKRIMFMKPGLCAAVAAAALTVASAAASAQEADPMKILKAMSDYVGSQKALSFSYDAAIEVVTPSVEKIQFASSGSVLLNRPDKARVTRTGGYADVELVFDGKTATVLGKNINAYAQLDAPGTTADLVERIRKNAGVDMPGADLLSPTAADDMTVDAYEGKVIGRGVIDGVECDHLAFRGPEADWQLWVEVGAKPVPHKYVITSKAVAGAPQYTLTIKDWKTDPAVASDAFSFKAPSGANKVDLASMSGIDEIPEGMPTKGAGK
jgi:hypothetical protein